jgi:hypothetical protein
MKRLGGNARTIKSLGVNARTKENLGAVPEDRVLRPEPQKNRRKVNYQIKSKRLLNAKCQY